MILQILVLSLIVIAGNWFTMNALADILEELEKINKAIGEDENEEEI